MNEALCSRWGRMGRIEIIVEIRIKRCRHYSDDSLIKPLLTRIPGFTIFSVQAIETPK
jgi:hypothetical protein